MAGGKRYVQHFSASRLTEIHLPFISSFCGHRHSHYQGAESGGNRHQVELVARLSDAAVACERSRAISPAIYVEITIDNQNVAQLRYYHNGHQVQNCGSGTLAAAAFFHSRPDLKVERYQNRSVRGRFLQRSSLSGYSQEGLVRFKAIPKQKDFWRSVCRCPIKEVFEVVGKNYALVELSSPAQVARLRPRFKRLSRSPLALIVTAKTGRRNPDYVMRYFAPQYGNDEDAATGSANGVLMQYWSARLNTRSILKGLQLSPAGGMFYGKMRVAEEVTELYGRTLLE